MEAIALSLTQLSGGATDALPVMESIESFCENDTCEPVKEELPTMSEDSGMQADDQRVDPEKEAPVAGKESQHTMQRDELVSMIQGLRGQGLSYEKIARQLEENQIPTISGRGKWRGQAVSKLCQ
jgi:hypothetical protein